jgi:hypothetical protein
MFPGEREFGILRQTKVHAFRGRPVVYLVRQLTAPDEGVASRRILWPARCGFAFRQQTFPKRCHQYIDSKNKRSLYIRWVGADPILNVVDLETQEKYEVLGSSRCQEGR